MDELNWRNVESGSEPALEDTTSSRVYNYARRNIRSEQRTDPETGDTSTWYTYEECKIPKESWGLYKALEQSQANLEYIAMMSDIDIDE